MIIRIQKTFTYQLKLIIDSLFNVFGTYQNILFFKVLFRVQKQLKKTLRIPRSERTNYTKKLKYYFVVFCVYHSIDTLH